LVYYLILSCTSHAIFGSEDLPSILTQHFLSLQVFLCLLVIDYSLPLAISIELLSEMIDLLVNWECYSLIDVIIRHLDLQKLINLKADPIP
jgi:hypothetical protein